MPICPNCRQRTKGPDCEYCGYPILKRTHSERHAHDEAKKDIERTARERARQEAEAARKAEESAKLLRRQEAIQAKEKVRYQIEEEKRARESAELFKKQAAEARKRNEA